MNHGISFAELIAHIDEAKTDEAVAPVFGLADLSRLYAIRLEQLGVEQGPPIHSSKLKDCILAQFPDLQAHKDGRDVLLAFDQDIGLVLTKTYKEDYDEEAICLAKAAKIIRRDMIQIKGKFSGSFDKTVKEHLCHIHCWHWCP